MSDDTERRLHDQLAGLGTIEPSPGLADSALREAKQRRRRGMAAIAAAAAVVLAIAIAVPLTVRHNSSGPTTPPHGPAQRNVVVNYVTFSATNPNGTLTVLDPKTGRYVKAKLFTDAHARLDVFSAVVSPDGQQYAISDGKHVGTLSDVLNDPAARLRTLDSGQTAYQSASWSPDSSRLLIPMQGVNLHLTLTGFRLYDARTKQLGNVIRLPSNDVSRLVWAGNGSEVIGFAGHKLRYFDLAGKLQRTVTLPKHVALSSAISPDGRYMALNTALFDLTTGHTISLQLPRKRQMAPAPLGWLDDDHYAVDWPSSNGKTVEHRVLLFTNSGKLVKSITLPCGTSAMPGTGGKSTGVVMQLGYGADYPSNSGLRL